MSRINSVSIIRNGKKENCFEIVTNDKTFSIQAENQVKLNEWIQSVQFLSQIHVIKDKFKNRVYILSDHYCHQLVSSGKRLVQLVCRITGITKAVILAAAGKLKLSKVSNVNVFQINTDNDLLGNSLTSTVSSILKVLDNVYEPIYKAQLDTSIAKFRKACLDMNIHGIGTQNESALNSVVQQTVKELDDILAIPIPTPKIEILFLVSNLANKIRLYAESTSNESRISEGKQLYEYSLEFPKVIDKVFQLITDMTYASPFLDRGKFVPRLIRDVTNLVKDSKFYSTTQTYATNASKTLFYVLNQMREIIKKAYPHEPREDEFPQVGPHDAQFLIIDDAEFDKIMEENSFSYDFMYDEDGDIVPPPPDDEDDEDFVPPPPPEEDDIEGLGEGEMILHSYEKPKTLKFELTHPRTQSHPDPVLESPRNQEEPPSVVDELDVLLQDTNKRNSMPHFYRLPTSPPSQPGSMRKKMSISIRSSGPSTPINYGTSAPGNSPHIMMSSSPMSSHSMLSYESGISDKDVVDELDALLINHSEK